MRKIAVFILSLVLAMNCFALSAFAAESGAEPKSVDARIELISVNGSSPTNNVTVYAGSSFSIDFKIVTDATGGRYTASVSGSGFSMDGSSATRSADNYDGGTITIPVRTDSELSSGRYPVALSVEYTADGATASMSHTVNINVVGYTEPNAPDIPELDGNVDLTINSAPKSAVSAGETFTVDFTATLNNIYSTWGYYGAKGVVTVSGDGFSLAGYLAEQDISIGRNSVTVLCEDGTAPGRKRLTLTVVYTVNGETYTASRTLNIDVVAEEEEEEVDESNDKASFSLVSASIPEGKGRTNLATTLGISFKNNTAFEAKNVTVKISGLSPTTLMLNTYTDTVEIGDVAGGKSINASFPVKFPEFPLSQTSVTVELTYDTAAGPQSQSFNIYLQATEKEPEKEPEIPNVDASLNPKVIVKSYNVDVDNVTSGEEFTLTIVLENTSTKKDLQNMTVKVTPGSNYNSGSGASSGPVFSLIDGTSSFYTDFFEKGGTMEYTIRMKCSSSAGAGSYPIDIEFDFQYERDGGGGYSEGRDSLSINLPVVQPIKFDLMDWYPPTECGPDGTYISFQYFNKSRNPMSALAISVEGDFVMPEQYVGSLAASSYDYFSGMITPVDPSAVGEVKTAILVFTFSDAADNEQRIEYPFDVMITEGAMWGGDDMMWGGDDMMWGGDIGFEDPGFYGDDFMPVDGDGAENGGLQTWAKIAIPVCAVVVLAVIVVVVVKKVKAKRDEEDEED